MLQRPAQQLESMSHTLTCRTQMDSDSGDDELSAHASRDPASVVDDTGAGKKHALAHFIVQSTRVQQCIVQQTMYLVSLLLLILRTKLHPLACSSVLRWS